MCLLSTKSHAFDNQNFIHILGSQKYLGCYADTKNRDLVGVLENLGKKNTLEKCLALCLKKSKLLYKFFNRYFVLLMIRRTNGII